MSCDDIVGSAHASIRTDLNKQWHGLSVLLLSGPIAVGKSTVSSLLVSEHGFGALKSSAYLKALAHDRALEPSRLALQELGDSLDAETGFSWVIDKVAIPAISSNPDCSRWLFDSVRKAEQVRHFRREFGRSVFHVHFVADEETLQKRFASRLDGHSIESAAELYAAAVQHSNEVHSRSLVAIADLVIDLTKSEPRHVAQRIAERFTGAKA